MSDNKIVMVDLLTQYQRIKKEIDGAISHVLEKSSFIGGTFVEQFASDLSTYLDIPYVIPCANGTDALQIALMALDAKPGDEVILPSFTYIATAEVVALLKLNPVFVDVCWEDFCLDVNQIESRITPKTKAIVPVHMFGQACNMDDIMEIASKHGLAVVEDNAQAIGCRYKGKSTGGIGTIGTTSFFPSKNLGAYGDGGALFTRDAELAHKMKMIANHGQSKRYYHDIVGCNSRLDAIQAAILSVKLKYLDEYNQARQKVASVYNSCFSAHHDRIEIPQEVPHSNHVYHQYTLKLRGQFHREQLIHQMQERGIPCMIYYPVPCHKQKMFEQLEHIKTCSLPVTDQLEKCVLSLPIHTEMKEETAIYIAKTLIELLKN